MNNTLVTSSLPQRPFRDTTRQLLEQAAAESRSFVVTRDAFDELQAQAYQLHATHDDAALPRHQLAVISDTLAPHDVLVTASEQQRRLSAVQLEQRLTSKRALLAARTEAALTHAIDAEGEGCDEAFMLGATKLTLPAFAACETAFLQRAGRSVETPSPEADALIEQLGLSDLLQSIRAELVDNSEAGERALRHGLRELARAWHSRAQLQTFGEAVADMMNWPIMDSFELPMAPAQWREFTSSRPLAEVRDRADVLGILPDWDFRHARTLAGFHPVRSGIEYAIARSLAAAPHADVLWLVAPSADLGDAKTFADAIKARHPDKLLAYQLAPHAEEALAQQDARAFSTSLTELGFTLHVMTEGSACARQLGATVHLVP